MSEQISIIKNIQSLNLNSTDLGNNLNDMIESINDNFKLLSNTSLLKGDKGDSLGIVEKKLSDTVLYNDKTLYDWHRNAIESLIMGDGDEMPINSRDLDSNDSVTDIFNGMDSTSVSIIKNDNGSFVKSLPYIFIDGRFRERLTYNIKDADDNKYINKKNYSCIIIFKYTMDPRDSQLLLSVSAEKINLFPTIYYDTLSGQFKWNINGSDTNILAEGPQGNTYSADLCVFGVGDNFNKNTPIEITKVYNLDSNNEYHEYDISDTIKTSFTNIQRMSVIKHNNSFWLSKVYYSTSQKKLLTVISDKLLILDGSVKSVDYQLVDSNTSIPPDIKTIYWSGGNLNLPITNITPGHTITIITTVKDLSGNYIKSTSNTIYNTTDPTSPIDLYNPKANVQNIIQCQYVKKDDNDCWFVTLINSNTVMS